MVRLTGSVRYFDVKKGTGTVQRDANIEGEEHAPMEYRIVRSTAEAAVLNTLVEGDRIEFSVQEGFQGPFAVEVKKI